jgi:hypothetical protein
MVCKATIVMTRRRSDCRSNSPPANRRRQHVLVCCDTSPRNTGILGEADVWEFGAGADFCLSVRAYLHAFTVRLATEGSAAVNRTRPGGVGSLRRGGTREVAAARHRCTDL